MSNRRLILYSLILIFIVASPFLSFIKGPEDIFVASELIPSHRMVISEMKKASRLKEPLDVLFLGRSSMQNAIHPKLIEEKLETSNREYRVYMAGLREGDPQGIYSILKEFLSHRKVRVVVLSDAFIHAPPGLHSGLLFDQKDFFEIERLLPLESRLQLWKMAIFATPLKIRNILLPMNLNSKTRGKETEAYFNSSNGRIPKRERLGKGESPKFVFESMSPKRIQHYSQALVSTEDESISPTYIQNATNQYFVQRMIELSLSKGAKFYFHQEALFENPHSQTRIMFPPGELGVWNQKISGTLSLPWGWVFPDLSKEEASWYFGNISHFNDDGSVFYSRALVPALKKIFEDEGE